MKMTMTKWDILGIEPTMQTSEIKRAYTKMLKKNHPEDNPAGFQRLREAYEAALKEAQAGPSGGTSTTVRTDLANRGKAALGSANSAVSAGTPRSGKTSRSAHNLTASAAGEEPGFSAKRIAEQMMGEVAKLYDDLFARMDEKRWQLLLDSEAVWDLDVKQILDRKMLVFLMDHHRLPKPVWVLLDKYFFWTERELELFDRYPKNFISFLLEQIRRPWELQFRFFRRDQACDYESFIDYREEAHRALIANELEEAEPYLSAAYQIFADDPDLLRLIGLYHVRQGEWKHALPAFDQWIAGDGVEEDAYLYRAGLYLKLGETDKAVADYEHVLMTRPDDLNALSGLAQCYAGSGRLAEARSLYARMIGQCAYDMDARVRWMDVSRRLAEQQRAELDALAGDPEPEALLALAELYWELGQHDECCRMLERLERQRALSYDQYLLWGQASVKQKRWEAGMAYFDKAFMKCEEEGLDGSEVAILKGTAYMEMADPVAAIREFKRALASNSSDPDILYHLADAYRLGRNYGKAAEYATRAIAVQPARWQYYSLRGLCYCRLGQFREALDDYEYVIESKPDDAEGWYRKAVCHLNMGDYATAKTGLEKALAYGCGSEGECLLAVACFWLGDLEEALKAIRKYKHHAPEAPEGYLLAGDIYRAIGRCDEAQTEYARGSDLHPDHYLLNKMAAYCLLMQDRSLENIDKLTLYLDRLQAIDPQDEWGLLQRVRLSIDSRHWDKGRHDVEQYLAVVSEEQYNSCIRLYSGVIHYYLQQYSQAAEQLEIDYRAGPRGDTCSYLSMVYYELGDMNQAERYARQAVELDPTNNDYGTRYEGIMHRKTRTRWQRWLWRNSSSHKLWPSTVPIERHKLQIEPALHFELGAAR